ncbi:hypothetical protein [Streptomyces sp. enrichment culture]|uniref:hypothetical protein n=1 Tax=Streptomyces sp. enrichment culture TaxID=1795815 RepID=UPI003F549033
MTGPVPARTTARPAAPGPDAAGELAGWSAFGSVLTCTVMLWCGVPAADAVGTAAGLGAVAGAAHLLIRRSGRVAAAGSAGRRGRRHRHGGGAHRG